MKRKVIITKLPKAQSGLDVKMNGLNSKNQPWSMASEMAEPGVSVNSTLKPVPRSQANVEAEKGETAILPDKSGIPNTFKIGGNRHSSGGTPLNLPQDSFIYSDTRDMMIKDKKILSQFGVTGNAGVTPATIAKKYDIGKFKQILLDKDTDKMQKSTAEGMIANYNLKLAKLALFQESMKGFPKGIPAVAIPYLESQQINPAEFIQMNPQEGTVPTVNDEDQMRIGGAVSQMEQYYNGGTFTDYFQAGGANQITKPKRNDRVILNPSTGQLEVYNWAGKKVGIMNAPQQVQQPINQQQAIQQSSSSTTTSSKTTKAANVPENAIVVKRGDYNTDEEYITARNAQYKAAAGKPVYTQTADGKYSKVVFKATTQPGTQKEHLDLIVQNFNDPQVQQALYEKTLAAYDTPGTLGKQPGFTKADIEALGPEGLANQFIEMQTRNLEGNKIMQDNGLEYKWFDNTTGKIKPEYKSKTKFTSLDDVFAKTSIGAPKSDSNKAIQQLSYIGYNDLIQDNRAGKITDTDLSTKLKPFGVSQFGYKDEKLRGNEDGTISKADGYYTNTTFGQIAKYEVPESYNEQALDDVTTETEDITTKADNFKDPQLSGPGAAWWLQDIIKTGHAAGNMARIKKYNPWQATPGVVTPEVTFFDPTRELAANSEQANIAAQTLAQFTGPQSFNARNTQVQGQSLKNAADINSKYNNMNVSVSNQQEAQNAQIMNQQMSNRAQLATGLYDKYQIANQQFDNAKGEARNALVQQYVNAITNKNYTANLNKMNPQFAVDPSIGGEYYFHDPRALKADFSKSPEFSTVYNKLLEENPTLKKDPSKAADIAMKIMGMLMVPENPYLEYQSNKGVTPQVAMYPGGYEE